MINLHALLSALHLLGSSWQVWMVVVPGILIGLLVHAVPGLTTAMALAICLPLIPYMSFLEALIFMTAMYAGTVFGVAIPAILLNIPGTASAVGTTFDGFPMARAGKHNEALGLALAASCFGQAVVYLLLLCLIGPIGSFSLKLGPPEMLMLSLWGVTLIGTLSGHNLSRGLFAGAFGLLLGTVGLSPRGIPRGTFGIPTLLDGVPIVPAIVGLFAVAELFNLATRDYIVEDTTQRRVRASRILAGMGEAFRHPGTMLRGALLGSGIGVIPGGHAIANLLSYSEARRSAKDPEKFGTGDPRGIVAAESANGSSEGGSMATLLALGIPTGGVTAVMLVAFGMKNITGGPSFMLSHLNLAYAVILSSIAQVGVLAIVGFAFVFVAGFVVKVRLRMLVPTVLALAVIGSYVITRNMTGPITMAVFALIGWVMNKLDYSTPAAVVGLLLGRDTEGNLLRTYQMSGGHMSFLLTRPIAIGMFLLLIGSILLRRLKPGKSIEHKGALVA